MDYSVYSWISEKINVVIVIFIGLFLSVFIIHYPISYTILFLAFFVFTITFFLNPKMVIYLLIIVVPLMPILTGYTKLDMGKSYFSINIGGILNIGVTFLAIVLLFIRKSQIFKYKLSTPMILFLGILMLSILFSPLKFISLRQWFRYAMPAMVYFIVLENFNNKEQIHKLLKFALLSFIIPTVVGFWQLISGNEQYVVQGLNRIFGTLGHPNKYAMFIIVFSLLAIFLFFESKSYFKCTYFIFFSAMVILLFYTFSRVGWAAFLVTISIFGFLKYRKSYFSFLYIGVLAIVLLPGVTNILWSRLQPDASFWTRFDLNDYGLSLFSQRPILGHGVGSYIIISEQLFGSGIARYGIKIGLAPHNDYIRFLAETGILGFVCFIFLMYSALKLSAQIFKQTNLTVKNYGIFLISLITAILVVGITSQGFEYAGFYFWFFLAIGEIYLHNLQNKKVAYRGA